MRVLDYLQHLRQGYRLSPNALDAYMKNLGSYIRGFRYAEKWEVASSPAGHLEPENSPNRLREYFENNQSGPGIWKWEHYFEVYERHFARFRQQAVNILEIGVYSGGSLGMWRDYFGPGSHIFGVDIEPACRVYEREGITVLTGDQRDRGFWKTFRDRVPRLDVLIDDGGHKPSMQMVTLEEMLPHLSPGGVYLCEDIHGIHNEFIAFASGLVNELNRVASPDGVPGGLQRQIHSVHLYPYLLVIEKRDRPLARLHAPKHGTEWQPFYAAKASTDEAT